MVYVSSPALDVGNIGIIAVQLMGRRGDDWPPDLVRSARSPRPYSSAQVKLMPYLGTCDRLSAASTDIGCLLCNRVFPLKLVET